MFFGASTEIAQKARLCAQPASNQDAAGAGTSAAFWRRHQPPGPPFNIKSDLQNPWGSFCR
jgi:hypothetical protein